MLKTSVRIGIAAALIGGSLFSGIGAAQAAIAPTAATAVDPVGAIAGDWIRSRLPGDPPEYADDLMRISPDGYVSISARGGPGPRSKYSCQNLSANPANVVGPNTYRFHLQCTEGQRPYIWEPIVTHDASTNSLSVPMPSATETFRR